MEFVTVKEKAIEWNLSEKIIQFLCNENKILGAKKVNNSWIIPANYKKPLNEKEKNNLKITPLDLAFLSECIIENQNIVTNYKINYNLTKDNMLNPKYNLKKIYSATFILDKYYNFDLEKYIGQDLNELDEYIEKIQAKHILTKTEVNNEFNKFVLLISKIILDFLKQHSHQVFSAQQIIEVVKGEKISASAVYRNLAELEASGEVKKVSKSGSRKSLYQYFDGDACKNQIHLFCGKCETSFHMNIDKAQLLSQEILATDDFQIDKGNTVIYGTCSTCKRNGNVTLHPSHEKLGDSD